MCLNKRNKNLFYILYYCITNVIVNIPNITCHYRITFILDKDLSHTFENLMLALCKCQEWNLRAGQG